MVKIGGFSWAPTLAFKPPETVKQERVDQVKLWLNKKQKKCKEKRAIPTFKTLSSKDFAAARAAAAEEFKEGPSYDGL